MQTKKMGTEMGKTWIGAKQSASMATDKPLQPRDKTTKLRHERYGKNKLGRLSPDSTLAGSRA